MIYALSDLDGNILQVGVTSNPKLVQDRAVTKNRIFTELSGKINPAIHRISSAGELELRTDIDLTIKQWSELRRIRTDLLTASDWTQLSDATVGKRTWAAYRQALRDLPDNTTDPTDITWPTPPEGN